MMHIYPLICNIIYIFASEFKTDELKKVIGMQIKKKQEMKGNVFSFLLLICNLSSISELHQSSNHSKAIN